MLSYARVLREWKLRYAPQSSDETVHARFNAQKPMSTNRVSSELAQNEQLYNVEATNNVHVGGKRVRGFMPYGIVRSPRGISLSAESDRQCHSICGCCCHRLRRRPIPCDGRRELGVEILYPCCRLPAQTCHRQL